MSDELLSSGSTGIVSAEDADLSLDVDLSTDTYDPTQELPATRDSEYLERTDDQLDVGPVSSSQSSLAPLSYWDRATKQTFSMLPEKTKKVWLSSAHKDAVRYERALAKLDADYAPLAEIGEILAPVADSVIPKFGSVANYVKALLIEDSIVGTDPAVHIARIMRDMGVKRQDIDYAMDRLPQVEEQLRTIIPLQMRAEQAEKNSEYLIRQQQLEDERALKYFYSQTDRRGNPLYPEFEALRGYIYELVIGMEKEAEARGQQLQPDQIDLDALYKKALAVRDVLARDHSQQGIGLNKNAMGEMPGGYRSTSTPGNQRFVGPFDASRISLDDDRVYRQMAEEASSMEDPSEVSYGDMGSDE